MEKSQDLPEVVRQPQEPSTLPEVVPELDSTPQYVSEHDMSPQQRQAQAERDKYPAYYDTAPMIPFESPTTSPDYGPEAYPSPITPGGAAASHLIMSPGSSVPWDTILPAGDSTDATQDEKAEAKRICGLKKKTFIIAVVLALLVVIAAVVGGVVGAVTKSKSKSNDDASSTNQPPGESQVAPTGTSSSSTGTSPTQVTPPAPTKSLTNLSNETSPGGMALQAYSGVNFTGQMTRLLRIEGYYDIPFAGHSYVWLPNGTDECCVTFCTNRTTATGWWCEERRRPEASEVFRRVQIWCGRNNKEVAPIKKVECSPPPGSPLTVEPARIK